MDAVMKFVQQTGFYQIFANCAWGSLIMVGVAGFIISIPVMLYLFFIHAFSGKRPVKMRTICLLAFVFISGCLHHLFSNPEISSGIAMFADLYEREPAAAAVLSAAAL